MKRAIELVTLLCLAVLFCPALVVGFFYAYDALTGINTPCAPIKELHPDYPELGVEWKMHPVDNPGDWLPNGLSAADVDDDGHDDYVTNYEFNGRIRVAFHPGDEPRDSPWHADDASYVTNAEKAAFGDLENDGCLDIVVAHGIEHTDQPPGIGVLWGSKETQPVTAEPQYAWTDGGDIPSSAGGWQFLYVQTIDLDVDGDLDIMASGRASRMAGGGREGIGANSDLVWAGIRWFENPGEESRDLSRWDVHDIDPYATSGHGFELRDIDRDGNLDIANNNSDWDTPDEEENVVWYENPGVMPDMYLEWPSHEIYRGDEFYGKEQVVIADLDGDGLNDILTQTENDIYWFRSAGNGPSVLFELVPIEKHPAARWCARALETADVNGDGRLDIIGALIHREGSLPTDKAALFWMEQGGDGWLTHVIKWGDGFWGLGTFNGEKWDQLILHDVDGDGDLDIVANFEEYNRLRSIISVVWFENPTESR
jgi:hypothetical protein